MFILSSIFIQFSTSATANSSPPFPSDPSNPSDSAYVPRLVLQLLVHHQLLLWVSEEIQVIIAVALIPKTSKPQALVQILLMPQLPQRNCGVSLRTSHIWHMFKLRKSTWALVIWCTVNTSLTHSRDGSSSQGRQSYQYSKVALQLLLHATFCTSILYSLISCRLHPLPRRASLDNRKWDREYWKNMIPCLILGPQGKWQYTEHSKLGVS